MHVDGQARVKVTVSFELKYYISYYMCSIKNPNDVVMNYIRETNRTHVR